LKLYIAFAPHSLFNKIWSIVFSCFLLCDLPEPSPLLSWVHHQLQMNSSQMSSCFYRLLDLCCYFPTFLCISHRNVKFYTSNVTIHPSLSASVPLYSAIQHPPLNDCPFSTRIQCLSNIASVWIIPSCPSLKTSPLCPLHS
jgi:hypothetical protein